MSVCAALRGPFLALSDDALIALRHTQTHLHRLRKRDETKLTELTQPVGDVLDVLARLHSCPRLSRPALATAPD